MTILVTGGAGFIGSNFVLEWFKDASVAGESVVNLDALTYAGNLENLASLEGNSKHQFVKGDITDAELVRRLIAEHKPRAIVHFAAESHVDRSIHGPGAFVKTNVEGTFALLEAARAYWQGLGDAEKSAFRFHHVSTDEVYGSLKPTDPAFAETNPFEPNSPYSASKAASDHLVRAWHHTYGLPVVTTNCSNNYGQNQFPEKLIPLFINNIVEEKPLPVYGDGQYTRDWLYVVDHARAIDLVYHEGENGETYNIGGFNEWTNIDLIKVLCAQMDEKLGREKGSSEKLITYVKDRPGHDRRYAIDATKINKELGWSPSVTFEEGLAITIDWYLSNAEWLKNVTSGTYQEYYDNMYAITE